MLQPDKPFKFTDLSFKPKTFRGMWVRLSIGAVVIALSTNRVVSTSEVAEVKTELSPYTEAVKEYHNKLDPMMSTSAKDIIDSLDDGCDSGAPVNTLDSNTNTHNLIARKYICPELDKQP